VAAATRVVIGGDTAGVDLTASDAANLSLAGGRERADDHPTL
jgi:hypothetical protein